MRIQFFMFSHWWAGPNDAGVHNIKPYLEAGLPFRVYVDHKVIFEMFDCSLRGD